MSKDLPLEFYKKFYRENRVKLLQYDNLRKHFAVMVDEVLGEDYYNTAPDVYNSDRMCCEAISLKRGSRPFLIQIVEILQMVKKSGIFCIVSHSWGSWKKDPNCENKYIRKCAMCYKPERK